MDDKALIISDHIVQTYKAIISKDTISTHVIKLVALIMEQVEKVYKMPGQAKKTMAITIINDVMSKTIIGGSADPVIDALVRFTIPYAIDTLCAIAKGDISLQTIKSCGCCCVL